MYLYTHSRVYPYVPSCPCSLRRKHLTFVSAMIQSPSPRRRKCSKSSSCSDAASNPPHTSTLTLVIAVAIVQWPKLDFENIGSFLLCPFLQIVKVTQVSTQDLPTVLQCRTALCITLCLRSFPPPGSPSDALH